MFILALFYLQANEVNILVKNNAESIFVNIMSN